ncbi:MAG: mandelate racemase/muconate lactonizing enzyme family protein [Pseudomonadota bacterium]|nr:mandelate racemase/muconate lactonizing enzyme family protein [Pseudomonadota bacterium]
MPKVRSVSVAVCVVPLDRPTSFSSRIVHARHYGLVKVESESGQHGIGFCYVGSAGGRLFQVAVEDLLAPLLVGEESQMTERLWQRMYRDSLLQGRAGTVMRAISTLDIALWDLNARAAGLPLHRYLGAAHDARVPAYASGGYYLDGKGPKQLGDEVAGFVAAGFKAVKIKVGRLGPVEEEARVRAARDAIGPDVLLMLDANNAWSDLPQALEYLRRFEPHDPYWIEEPFSPDEIGLHARLAERTTVTVATGEIAYGRWYHDELMARGGCEILQTDAAVCGGISEWRRIAAMAAGRGITVSPHWFHDLHAPLVAATDNARFVEFFPDDAVLNFRRLVDRQLSFVDGSVELHSEPGLGFDFDEAALQRYALGSGPAWTRVGPTSC